MLKNYNQIINYAKEAYDWSDERGGLIKLAVYTEVSAQIKILNEDCSISFDQKTICFRNKVKEYIKTFLYTYDKKELMVVLLFLKAQFRSYISNSDNAQMDYELVNRHTEILYLISVLLEAKETEFKGRSLLNGEKNLAMAFRYTYYYSIICDNIEQYETLKRKTQIDINNIDCFIKEGYFYTDEYNEYMDKLLDMSGNIIPEEAEIETEELRDFLNKNGIGKESIREDISQMLFDTLGFTLEHLNRFCMFPLEKQAFEFYVFQNKKKYCNQLNSGTIDENVNYDNIITLFSLNALQEKNIINIHDIELRSIYEFEEEILFFPFDMCWNISCLEKFLYRNQFTERYFNVLDQGVVESIKKKLKKTETNISTYLSYFIAEYFHLSGYNVPLQDDLPMAEIKVLLTNQNKKTINLLKNGQDYGDIDILVLDTTKCQILNIEFKYFQPLVEIEKANDKFKLSDREKYIEKAKRREKIIIDNLPCVISYLRGDISDNYIVRTIVISPRPDYWLQQNSDVEYMDWVKLIDSIQNKTI